MAALYVSDHLHPSDNSSFIDSLDRDIHDAFYRPPYFSSAEAESLDANLQVGLYMPSTDPSIDLFIDEILDSFDG